jgi:hypothetical protein
MKAIETKAIITKEGTLIAEVPPDISLGEHSIIVVFQEPFLKTKNDATKTSLNLRSFAWKQNSECNFRREEIYGDDGR